MKKILLLLSIILLITACAEHQSAIINLKADSTNLAANYSLSHDAQKEAVILLHHLNGNKEEYNLLTSKLNTINFTTLALDFRGHGSSEGNKEEYELYINDIKAAVDFLKDKGFEEIHIIGAGIGANAAVKYATEDRDINKIITLSPRENYNGYKLPEYVNDYYGELYILAAGADTHFADNLKNAFKGEKKYRPYPFQQMYGTELLQDEDAIQKIRLFLLR